MNSTETSTPVASARNLFTTIRSHVDQIEAERELPQPLFEALADAGLFQLALPRTLGGPEIDFPTYVQVIGEIGRADASTAWVVNQLAIFATYAARMPPDVARLIWMDSPRSVVANTSAPTARAVVVPGGYRVTGRQGFSTGCRHAAWLAARAKTEENGEPGQRFFFVPAAEAELQDTWHVRGMRGTGTHEFVVNDVFVPTERTVLTAAPLRETGPLYQIPRPLVFAGGDAALALGTARSCLATFVDLAGAKTPHAMQTMLRDQSMVQVAVGQTEANLRAGTAMVAEAAQEIWAEATSTTGPTLDGRAALRLATTHAIRLAVQAVDTLYNAAGATAIYQGHPIQRYFQDIHVISQHQQARLSNYEVVGKHLLGLEIDQARV